MGRTKTWRSDPITDGQRKMIAAIRRWVAVPFRGRTKGAASDYIDKYKAEAEAAFRDAQLDYLAYGQQWNDWGT